MLMIGGNCSYFRANPAHFVGHLPVISGLLFLISTVSIDVCKKQLGYRHTLTMQWRGKVVTFESLPASARHLTTHITVNQLILDGPHLIELATVDQKFLLKSGLILLRQLTEQVSPDQIFALINFHDGDLLLIIRELAQAMIETFTPHISKAYCNNPCLRANDASGRSLALITYLIIKWKRFEERPSRFFIHGGRLTADRRTRITVGIVETTTRPPASLPRSPPQSSGSAANPKGPAGRAARM
jgi:hypothetical protein